MTYVNNDSMIVSLSRSLHNSAAGGYSVNMVDWKYSSFFR